MSRWQSRAACRDTPTELFFVPPVINGVPTREHEQALRICNRCPVFRECKKAGRGEMGTWAGTYSGYKHRGEERAVRCDRCGGLFVDDADRTCDSCLTLDELRRRLDRNARRKYPRRAEGRAELQGLTESFERLVELSVIEFEESTG